ncbi:hypothetical protein T552_01886 [Pneumocystis carinii B80]|uniref:Cytochrome c oxidase assembly protein COX16, mitochondrial n=1 Tax=Pneumocystis carinii (strain B80) TaxID=1408658 RepID=A0A0W4ZI28_PNEC8|nr:hypothetical protein T552_01886 [Pneumocystis carinii B80]KTW28024.1 hypothetical protein T552_01886 [Pneumocystis carinii B80]
MNYFVRKKYISNTSKLSQKIIQLNKTIHKYPFLLFGMPFITTILGGAYVLSISQQFRYDSRDQKIKQISEEQALGMKKNRRKINIKDEYYKLQMNEMMLNDWEQVRVERFPGEPDNILSSQK